ncbi:MAG TPA: IS1 family transposase [Bacteroidota bacterium]|nr:IS1 family transposase [Bacteroidota bacterium]
MANNLPIHKKALVLSLITEGQSIRATSRIAGVSQPTILKLIVEAGEKAKNFHDSMMQGVQSRFMQVDEIWCYVGCKQKRAIQDDAERGDFYTFIALDADTKLVPCYRVGKRTARLAASFMMELSVRVNTRFQLSTDAFPAYRDAVDRVFGAEIDYAQIHKEYREETKGEKRYSPAQIIRVTKKPITGEPINRHISTSYIERQNLTVRMQSRRFTRLTNGFSKKLRNLQAAVDVHFFYYNFIRIHQSLRVTPAMEAKITNRLWNWIDLLTWDNLAESRVA